MPLKAEHTHLLLGLALQLLGRDVNDSSALLGAVQHLSSQALPGWDFLHLSPLFNSSWLQLVQRKT